MFVSNHPQNLIRIPPGDRNFSTLLNVFSQKLAAGQVLQGKILDLLSGGRALVDLEGQKLTLRTAGGLTRGQNIFVKVEQVSPTINLRIIDPPAGRNVRAPVTQPGVTVQLTPAREGASRNLIAQNPDAVRVGAAMIKPYLVARQDLGAMAANLEKIVFNRPLPQGLKIDPGLLDRLRETLSVLLPREGKTPDDSQLREQVDRSGIRYEARVKKALATRLTPETRSALARDLKGQLLALQETLEKQLPREGEKTSLAAGRGQAIRELVHHIKRATDNIEFQQLSNQFARQDNNPILIQIPDPFSPATRTVKLYVREDQAGEGAKKGEKTNFHLTFLLNLSSLGNLRIDATTSHENVAAKITTEQKSVADHIANQLPRLESRLKEMGFDAAVTASVRETVEMDAGEDLNRMLIEEPSRLVDIKT
ncbi:MAG: flagellar hook-length control protein FliK [Nitrospinales bacterium]